MGLGWSLPSRPGLIPTFMAYLSLSHISHLVFLGEVQPAEGPAIPASCVPTSLQDWAVSPTAHGRCDGVFHWVLSTSIACSWVISHHVTVQSWDRMGGLRSQARGALPLPEVVIFIKRSNCTAEKKLRLGNILLPSTLTLGFI